MNFRVFVLAIIAFASVANCASMSVRRSAAPSGRVLRGMNPSPLPPWTAKKPSKPSKPVPEGRVLRGFSRNGRIPKQFAVHTGRLLQSAPTTPQIKNVHDVVKLLTADQKRMAKNFAAKMKARIESEVNKALTRGQNMLDNLLKL